jgi:hypothetical protein
LIAPDEITEDAPRRARKPRMAEEAPHRRRRVPGSLNRMVQFDLDIFDPDQLDLEHYVYRWVNDEKGRIRRATRMDDYDFVTTAELGDFDIQTTDSESSERVRMIVGSGRDGGNLYAYLCKKRRAFWEQDNEEVVRNREDLMAGRVYRAEATREEEMAEADSMYAVKGNSIGLASGRRRGPVPRNF